MSVEAVVRSMEEDEELQLSTKKVKETHKADNNSDGISPRSKGRRSFYKERLTVRFLELMNEPSISRMKWIW